MANLAVFNKTIALPQTQSYLESVLKDKKSSFVTSLVSVVANNANLQACEPVTLMYAALKATALDLPFDPNLGFAYVIPYNNHGKTEAQFQLGVKGLTQLAMRSGQFQTINVDVVFDGEISGVDKLSGEIKLDGAKKSDKIVGYFAYFRLVNGFSKTLYMTVEDIEKHANRFSKAVNYGPWKTDFDAMAKKTVLKQILSKFAPLSVDMQLGIKSDQAVYRDETLNEDYVDNQYGEVPDEKDEQVERVRKKAEEIKQRARKSIEKVEEPDVVEEAVEEAPSNENLPPIEQVTEEVGESVFPDAPDFE